MDNLKKIIGPAPSELSIPKLKQLLEKERSRVREAFTRFAELTKQKTKKETTKIKKDSEKQKAEKYDNIKADLIKLGIDI